MPKLRVQSFGISIDGYAAGPNQELNNPLGMRGPDRVLWPDRITPTEKVGAGIYLWQFPPAQ